jgi:hypothetical protein
VIDQVNGTVRGRGPYRNIKHAPGSIRGFKRNMLKLFPNATHINFYDHKGNFLFQERYQVEQIEIIKRKRLIVKYLDYAFYVTGQPRFWNEMILKQWDP